MTSLPLWTYRTTLAAEPSSVRRAREFVHTHLSRHDLPHLVDDVALVVSELATNSLMHAHTPFTVVLQASGGTVRLLVEDGSPSRLMRTTGRVLDTTGRGIDIVESLSLGWGVTSRPDVGKAVWAEFDAGVAQARDGVPAVRTVHRQREG